MHLTRQHQQGLSDKFEGHVLVLLVLLLLHRVLVYARKRARRQKLINLQSCQVSSVQNTGKEADTVLLERSE